MSLNFSIEEVSLDSRNGSYSHSGCDRCMHCYLRQLMNMPSADLASSKDEMSNRIDEGLSSHDDRSAFSKRLS